MTNMIDINNYPSGLEHRWQDLADELVDLLFMEADRNDIRDFFEQFLGELTGLDAGDHRDADPWTRLVADRLTERAVNKQPHYRTDEFLRRNGMTWADLP